MFEQEKPVQTVPKKPGCALQIGFITGSMIPIMSVDENAKDKRKNQILQWKEARLSLAHEHGRVTPKFGVVFQGNVDEAGQSLLNSAIFAGFGQQTHLHTCGR